mmetsp:Transcript_27370/g.88432  ORF Transcript_27370/g.88432 Transcript_27370/m.88432 type:complete len:384 (-) Transcript_27370:363-1514(-)
MAKTRTLAAVAAAWAWIAFAQSGASFEDTDPMPGQLTGTLRIPFAQVPEGASAYAVHWADKAGIRLKEPLPLGETATFVDTSGRRNCGEMGSDSHRLKPGTIQPKAVNGDDAPMCKFTWQASLRQGQGGHHFCGATLISPKWLLSAAHCETSMLDVVVLGDRSVSSTEDPFEVMRTIKQVIPHPLYVPQSMLYDYMLIEMEEEVEMNQCIGFACIPDEDVAVGADCLISGWGTLGSDGYLSDILQEGQVKIMSNEECERISEGAYELGHVNLCAQSKNERGFVATCQGDSGGPLVCPRYDGRWEIRGPTSYGIGCADPMYPGIYSRTTHVNAWITEHSGLLPDVAATRIPLSEAQIPGTAASLVVQPMSEGVDLGPGFIVTFF